MIYITGAMNGEQERFSYDNTIRNLTAEDVLIVCGGFDFMTCKKNTIMGMVENAFLDELEQLPYTVLFIDGEDDNFDLLNAYPVETWNGGKVHRIRKNIAHLMRGQVFTIDGKKVFAMGGGYRELSVLPSESELVEGWQNLVKHGLAVDMIITYVNDEESPLLGYFNKEHAVQTLMSFFKRMEDEVHYHKWYIGYHHSDIRTMYNKEFYISRKQFPVWLDVLKFEPET